MRTKSVLALLVKSLTVMVIVVEPLWFKAGEMITVRFAPLPPKVILAFGTSVTSLDDAVSVRFATGVSGSLTVNAMPGVGVSSLVV